jgi:hypothetical protein
LGEVALEVGEQWVYCAPENETCRFPGTRQVRYGDANGPYFTEAHTGSVSCDNAEFGDPENGQVKHCQVLLNPSQYGKWEPPIDWSAEEFIAVHASLLPTGKVFMHNATDPNLLDGEPVKHAMLWDPATLWSTNPSVRNGLEHLMDAESDAHARTGSELFCVGFDLLPDGNLLTTGNQPNQKHDHDRHANRFDFRNQSWSRVADTNEYRYYPTNAMTATGDVLVAAGTLDHSGDLSLRSAPLEVFTFDGRFKALTGTDFDHHWAYYPWIQLAPNGKLFYAGPQPTMYYFGTGALGAQTSMGTRDSAIRNYGSYAMYDVGKILVVGGRGPIKDDNSQVVLDSEDQMIGETPLASAKLIDLNGALPVVSSASNMSVARRQLNATVLANGEVLVTGGTSGVHFPTQFTEDRENNHYSTEIWSPVTGAWSTLHSQVYPRVYHSTALLLPDARVFTGGSGMPQSGYGEENNQYNAQVFSPPYLFASDGTEAIRPIIHSGPNTIGYSASFKLGMSPTGTITKAHLIKLGTVTHSFNAGQRLVPLGIVSQTSTAITLQGPASPFVAPPGYYMVFLLNDAGVPSVAKIVQLQPHATVRLVSKLNGKALEVDSATQNNSTPGVKVGAVRDAVEQAWYLLPSGSSGGSHYFKLWSRANDRVLSTVSGATANGTALTTLEDAGSTTQQWSLSEGSSSAPYLELRLRSNDARIAEITGGTGSEGAAVSLQTDGGTISHQQWQIVPYGPVTITAVESGKVVTVQGGATSSVPLEQSTNQAEHHQMWSFAANVDGWVTATARHSGRMLDVWQVSTSENAAVYQATPNGGANQQWRLLPTADGSFKLQVRHTGMYLHVANHSLLDGGALVQSSDNSGGQDMLFRVVPAVSGQPHQVSRSGGQLVYQAHVQTYGWQPSVGNNQVAGTTGLSKRMEALVLDARGVRLGLELKARVHIGGGVGWNGWLQGACIGCPDKDENLCSTAYPCLGSVGNLQQIEAIQIELAGDRNGCSISYRGYVQSSGWQAWQSEGATAGTTGQSKRMEALQIQLVCN